jgi:hypothetical protein
LRCFSLVRATYQSTWLREIGALESYLRHGDRLAASSVIRELSRPRKFDALLHFIRSIREDVAGPGDSPAAGKSASRASRHV